MRNLTNISRTIIRNFSNIEEDYKYDPYHLIVFA